MLVIAVLKINETAALGTGTFTVSREQAVRDTARTARCQREGFPLCTDLSPSHSWCRCGPARTVTAPSWNRGQKGCGLSPRDDLPSRGDKIWWNAWGEELPSHPASAVLGKLGSLGDLLTHTGKSAVPLAMHTEYEAASCEKRNY